MSSSPTNSTNNTDPPLQDAQRQTTGLPTAQGQEVLSGQELTNMENPPTSPQEVQVAGQESVDGEPVYSIQLIGHIKGVPHQH